MVSSSETERISTSDLLLDLYECLTDPMNYEQLLEVLASWLASDFDPVDLIRIEKRSEKIWQLLVPQNLQDQEHENKPNLVLNKDLSVIEGDGTLPEGEIIDLISAEDLMRIKEVAAHCHSSQQSASETVVRLYKPGEDSATLCYVRCKFGEDVSLEVYVTNTPLSEHVHALIKREFRITDAEMEIVLKLLQGGSVASIAESLGRSVETVRTHIKSITSKFGQTSQRELTNSIRQIERLATSTISAKGSFHRSGEDRELILFDGRRITYKVYGKKADRTFVYFHDFLGGKSWARRDVKVIEDLGGRLISVSRPGYGRSDPITAMGFEALDTVSNDFYEILQQEKVDRCIVLAKQSGLAQAYSFCLNYPDMVERAVSWDSLTPVLTHNAAKLIRPRLWRMGALACRYAPMTLRVAVHLGMKRFHQFKTIEEMERAFGINEARLTKGDPEADEVMRDHLGEIFVNGDKGLIPDLSSLTVDWAKTGQALNSRPILKMIMNKDDPFIHTDYAKSFAHSIDASLDVLDAPYRNRLKGLASILKVELSH